jgi:DNA-binding winged helix-turn-helix (wHTH) protein/tetratricopeptide (TPR) repeat protein
MFVFSSFHLDVANASLRRGKQPIELTPKAFNVLRYLVEHAGQLVSKDELWRAVWPEVSVTDAALTVCVSDLRKALRDDSRTPRYIETLHRLGYRFIAPVTVEPLPPTDTVVKHQAPALVNNVRSAIPNVVGRQAELAQLHKWLGWALTGERQIVFVTGEAGIGKTTLVEEFLLQARPAAKSRLWLGRGQCIEHYGAGEPYLPVLDALGRLCRAPQAGPLVAILDKHAPAWLAQMPALLDGGRWKELQGRVAGASRERMLRELADALEVASQEQLLVLQLEDLHWSDYSTLEWLGFLARRQEPARLLVLATYRPVEVIVRQHPLKNLKQELLIHGHCQELPLSLLSEAAVMEYLTVRFTSADSLSAQRPGAAVSLEALRRLAHTVHQRTDGNPLFMVNVIDYLEQRPEVLRAFSDEVQTQQPEALEQLIQTPPSISEMIQQNVERLNPNERAVLEAATVAGTEFSAVAVAAALERPATEIEACCAGFARQQQLIQSVGTGEWPDGTLSATFRFLHGLYRDVLYERLPAGRRAELHRRIAESEERAWGECVGEIATELAHHYGKAGQVERTTTYLERAGEQARQRSAFMEALEHYQQALMMLNRLPQSAERDLRELRLRRAVFSMQWWTKGPSSHDVMEEVQHATALAEKCGQLTQLVMLMFVTGVTAVTAGRDVPHVIKLADRAVELAQRDGNPISLLYAHSLEIIVRFFLGDLVSVEKHLAAGMKYADNSNIIRYRNAGFTGCLVQTLGTGSLNALLLGRFELARQRLTHMLATANASDPYGLVISCFLAAEFQLALREYEQAEAHVTQSLELSEKHQFEYLTAVSRCYLGRVRTGLGGATGSVELIRQGIAGALDIGVRPTRWLSKRFLAEAQASEGAIVDALETVEQALQEHPEESLSVAATLKLRGELRMKQGLSGLAETDFREALKRARSMGAKMLELWAIMPLARLLASRGRRDEARAMLAEIYNWFTEGFDTADLREAKLLLDELSP